MSEWNVLLLSLPAPRGFWGMNDALPFNGKKSTMPHLGLLTIAGMFPANYVLKLVDMNVRSLTEEDLRWASIVFVSAMTVQQESLEHVINKCKTANVPIVLGGSHSTTFYDEIKGVNYFLLGEVEETLFKFLQEESRVGFQREGVICKEPENKPDLAITPLPRFDLVNFEDYDSMCAQFSRGCPFNCEYCGITKLYGHKSRTKGVEQMIQEFQLLYDLGWRGRLFLVDDNFIGQRKNAMQLLIALAKWQKERGNPFDLYTEASVNLAKYSDILDAMVEANFCEVFLGIETTNKKALLTAKKSQNVSSDVDYLLDVVKVIHSKGLAVTAGFILGLDSDTEDVFDTMEEFIQKSGTPIAMVGLLSVDRGTDLYKRLKLEGRLLFNASGNNLDITLNFVPEMDKEVLINGYQKVLLAVYDPTLRNYFKRCLLMFDRMGKSSKSRVRIEKTGPSAVLKSLQKQLFSNQGLAYIDFLGRVLIRYPRMLPDAVRLAIIGYHLERISREIFQQRELVSQ